MKPLPEPYASAPTPRTTSRIQDMHEEVSVDGASIHHLNYTLEFAKQLERENLWLREVVKLQNKIIEAIDEDSTCLGIHELRRDMKQALSAYSQLQEYLKSIK